MDAAKFVLDLHHDTIVEVNAQACKVLAYTREELLSLSISTIHPNDVSRLNASFQTALADGQDQIDEFVYLTKTGEHWRAKVSSTILRIAGRTYLLLVARDISERAHIKDITKRKQAEARIERKVRELAALSHMGQSVTASLELSVVLQRVIDEVSSLVGAEGVAILLLENSHQLVFAATRGISAERLHGIYMPATVGVAGEVIQTGKSVLVRDDEDQARIFRGIENTSGQHTQSLIAAPLQLGSETIGVMEAADAQLNSFNMDDLRVLEVAANWAAIAIENARLFETMQLRLKEVDALYSVSRGIAASLDVEQVLERVVALTQENFSDYHVHLFLVDKTSGLLVLRYGSAPLAAKLNYKDDRLSLDAGILGHVATTGQPIMINNVDEVPFFKINPLLPETRSELAVPLKVGATVLGVLDIQHDTLDAFCDDDLRLVAAIGDQVAIAVQNATLYTDLQIALDQEQSMRAQLIHAGKLAAMGELMATVAHELNNPIQTIQNSLYLIEEDAELSGQSARDLAVVLNETRRMADLVKRLRAVYRGGLAKHMQATRLDELLVEVHQLMRQHFEKAHVSLVLELVEDMPELQVDADQIKQVFLNLCLNAVDAMPQGGELKISSTFVIGWSKIIVTDTGHGMTPEQLKNVFEPFFTTKETGIGLGLAISYDIVRQHGGHMTVESQRGKGTQFIVSLPWNGASHEG